MLQRKFLTVGLWTVAVVAVFAILLPLVGPRYLMPLMMRFNPPPADLNIATTRLTEQGLYNVTFVSAIDPIAINQIHSWTLHIETTGGEPVEDAAVTVDGGMPQHGHGLPTRPQVTQNLGGGDYLVEGLKFQMGGWWEVRYVITADGQTDGITFNLVLE